MWLQNLGWGSEPVDLGDNLGTSLDHGHAALYGSTPDGGQSNAVRQCTHRERIALFHEVRAVQQSPLVIASHCMLLQPRRGAKPEEQAMAERQDPKSKGPSG